MALVMPICAFVRIIADSAQPYKAQQTPEVKLKTLASKSSHILHNKASHVTSTKEYRKSKRLCKRNELDLREIVF